MAREPGSRRRRRRAWAVAAPFLIAALGAGLALGCGGSSSSDPAGPDGGAGGPAADAAPEPQSGLRAAYYPDDFGPAVVQIDPTIDFDWGTGAPVDGVGADAFAVRWTGELTVPAAGTYAFAPDADDGVRLWVGGQRIVDVWTPGVHTPDWVDVDLPAGPVPIKLTYFEKTGPAHVTLRWRRPDGTDEVVPSELLRPAAADPTAPSPKPPYRNPVLDTGCADPGVLQVGDWYYLACTGGRFRIRRSHDLIHWHLTDSYILPAGGAPWSATSKYRWAPEIHQIGDGFVAYFVSADGGGQRAIGAAPADDPLGPYTMEGKPLLTGSIGVIDPNFFRTKGGNNYLLWKVAGTSVGQPTPIYIRKLGPRGLGFASGSKAIELIRNDPSSWEGSTTEAPWLIAHGGMYYLFYSGNAIDARYRVGVARASNLTGPYTKLGHPILGNNKTWVGPGHNAIAQVGGMDYIIYHAWPTKADGTRDTSRGRLLMVDRIHWGQSGWPSIGDDGTPSATLQPAPGADPDADP